MVTGPRRRGAGGLGGPTTRPIPQGPLPRRPQRARSPSCRSIPAVAGGLSLVLSPTSRLPSSAVVLSASVSPSWSLLPKVSPTRVCLSSPPSLPPLLSSSPSQGWAQNSLSFLFRRGSQGTFSHFSLAPPRRARLLAAGPMLGRLQEGLPALVPNRSVIARARRPRGFRRRPGGMSSLQVG